MMSVCDMMPLILSSLDVDSVTYIATWWMLFAGDFGGRMMLPGLENRKHCLRSAGAVDSKWCKDRFHPPRPGQDCGLT